MSIAIELQLHCPDRLDLRKIELQLAEIFDKDFAVA
jgi:hypothetical protein